MYDDLLAPKVAEPLPVLPLAATAWVLLTGSILHLLMFHDKRQARRRGPRIRERTLLWLAVLGGGIGGWLAMRLHRHKTLHLRFRIVFALSAIGWIGIIVYTMLR